MPLERAITERVATPNGQSARARLALDAADRLTHADVNAVAADLGVSERHLRRAFRETVGVSPKAFAKLQRFHRALGAARADDRASWASSAELRSSADGAAHDGGGPWQQTGHVFDFATRPTLNSCSFIGEDREAARDLGGHDACSARPP